MRYCLAFLSLTAVAGAAADAGPWKSVSSDAIRGHVEFLASDLLEGRAAASRGYDIAAAYVAAQFREAGLEPGGDQGGYFQAVPLLEAMPVLPGSSAQLVRENESLVFEYGTDYLPSADFTSASSTLTAPLVFAGFGVAAPEFGHDDLAHLELQGRIAVVLSGAPAKFANDQRAYYSSSHVKWPMLSERGAVGLITIDSLADAKRVPWERSVAMSWAPQMRWLDADGKPQNAFPELKLRFRFNHTAAARLFEGAPASLEQALAAADAGERQGFVLPGMLTLSATTGLRRTESANVLGVLRGTDPLLKNEYVVITAHLDHLGRGAAVNGDSIYNGAQDNALGVGILLELARALCNADVKPRRSILFAAVTAEEKGLLGSDFLAARA
ncbi:MAG TPA: M28 family metallopeptidase, partial [Steroidobacter sp.]|nr:M28 family metallopeptidase [Steroidobacter sp.]